MLAGPVKCAFGWICGTLSKIPLMWDFFFLGFLMFGQPEISQGLNLK